jgi:hypothetical protein
MNQHENDAMWKAYTCSTRSVAIRTTFAALRACLPSYVDLGMVRYLDYATGRLPTLNMFQYITHKRIQLSFEQEIRAVAFGLLPDQLGGTEFRAHLLEKEGDPGFKAYAPPVPEHPASRIVRRHWCNAGAGYALSSQNVSSRTMS